MKNKYSVIPFFVILFIHNIFGNTSEYLMGITVGGQLLLYDPNSRSKCDIVFKNSDLSVGIFLPSTRTKGAAMKYQQVTEKERYLLAFLKNSGRSVFQIAFALNRHRSTIYRELRRNRKQDICYGVDRACEMARARRYKSRRNSHFSQKEWEMVVVKLTMEEWSPEQISLKFREKGILKISWETIYKRIWKDKQEGGRLFKSLRQVSKKRRKRYRAYDSRGVLPGKRHISERPKEAWDRSEKGHFEGDLMHGKWGKPCVLTLVDRMTRLTIIAKLPNKTMRSVNSRLVPIIRKFGIKTITLDNGCEFHGYKRVERRTIAKFFFATPHHSWERGTNENTNGLIRQYLPKTRSMVGVTQWQCNRISKKLNTRPRKCLGLKTPGELYA